MVQSFCQAQYRDGLDKLNAGASSRYGKTFAQLAPAEIDTLLAPLREAWTYAQPADSLALEVRTAKIDDDL